MLNAAAEGGRGLLVETNKQEFLCHFERAELIMLEHGEERRYSTKFVVLDDSNEIAAVHKRIDSITHAPAEDFPQTSERGEPLLR